jgi:hypothetical protein
MANPNIVDVTTIYGVTAGLAVTTTAIATQISNSVNAIAHNTASSGKVFKINALYISNIDGASAVSVDVATSDGTSAFHITKGVSIPADSTLDVLSKPIYLNEGVGLYLAASAAGDAEAVVSYEEISDQ